MWVTVLRHGQAGLAATDRARNLTPRGESDIERAGGALADVLVQGRGIRPPEVIVHSPYQRTLQTAQRLAGIFVSCELIASDSLVPEARVDAAEGVVEAQAAAGHAHCVLVSHQPLVSHLLDHWLGFDHPVPPLLPGAWAVFEVDPLAPGCGRLAFWAAPPTYTVQGA